MVNPHKADLIDPGLIPIYERTASLAEQPAKPLLLGANIGQ